MMALSKEEYKAIEPYLRGIGVRTRITAIKGGVYYVQADNPYMRYVGLYGPGQAKRLSDDAMTDAAISCYKR